MGRAPKRKVVFCILLAALSPWGCAAMIGLENTTTMMDAVQLDAAAAADNTAPPVDAGANDAADVVVEPPCNEPNLVGRWRFDEGSGAGLTYDCTSNMLTGRLTSATWTEGKYGAALFFASAWVRVDDAKLLRINGAITLAAWIRIETLTGKTEYIIGKTAGGVQPLDGWRLAVDKSGQLSMNIGTGTALAETFGGAALPLKKWIHVAATYAPSAAVRLYVDGAGILNDTTGIPASSAVAPDDLHIGARSDGELLFRGAIDEVRIYDRALTAPEVAAIAN